MEILLHHATQVQGWRIAEIHQAIVTALDLKSDTYTLTQLRYHIRKLRAHGLVERDATLLLSPHGQGRQGRFDVRSVPQTCLWSHSQQSFRPPTQPTAPAFQQNRNTYYRADAAIQNVINQLAMAA